MNKLKYKCLRIKKIQFQCHSKHNECPPLVIVCNVTNKLPFDCMFSPRLFVPSSNIFGSRSSGLRSVNQLDSDDHKFVHWAVRIGASTVVRLPPNGTWMRAQPCDDSVRHQLVPYRLNTICGPINLKQKKTTPFRSLFVLYCFIFILYFYQ